MSQTFFRDLFPADVASRWRLLMYPRLRELPPAVHEDVLRIARSTGLDLLERMGILGGLVAITALLQAVGAEWHSPIARYCAQFALALPLIGCAVGPFLLRRTRRGLEIECSNRVRGRERARTADRL